MTYYGDKYSIGDRVVINETYGESETDKRHHGKHGTVVDQGPLYLRVSLDGEASFPLPVTESELDFEPAENTDPVVVPMSDETAKRLASAMEDLAHQLSLVDYFDIQELTSALNRANGR